MFDALLAFRDITSSDVNLPLDSLGAAGVPWELSRIHPSDLGWLTVYIIHWFIDQHHEHRATPELFLQNIAATSPNTSDQMWCWYCVLPCSHGDSTLFLAHDLQTAGQRTNHRTSLKSIFKKQKKKKHLAVQPRMSLCYNMLEPALHPFTSS